MKFLALALMLSILSSCASKVPPLASKATCRNTCAVHTLEYKDYEEDDGCYCGEYSED